ncbi:CC0125/CC1285 family lipoprotein [Candidatus Mycalebacterium sp.]
MRIKTVGVLLLCLLLTSCLATPYQKSGFRGGFTETQLAPDVFRVRFTGNAFTSRDRAQEFTLLRVSELCFDNGFAYFAIGDESNQVTQHTVQTAPATSHTTSSGTTYESGTVSSHGYGQARYSGSADSHGSSTTTYEPAKFTNLFKPNSYMLVRCFKKKPDDRYVFDGRFLIKSLKTKYKIKD